MNDADDRNVHFGGNIVKSGRCRGIAGNHNHFGIELQQIINDLLREHFDFPGRAGTVRGSRGVSVVNDFLAGELPHNFLDNCKSPHA
ncbi:hypothetical protein D3C73_1276100 [compost metagenome]